MFELYIRVIRVHINLLKTLSKLTKKNVHKQKDFILVYFMNGEKRDVLTFKNIWIIFIKHRYQL